MKRTDSKNKAGGGPRAIAWLVAGILVVSTMIAMGGHALDVTLDDEAIAETEPIGIDLLDPEGAEATLDADAVATIEWHDNMTGFNVSSTIPFQTVIVALCLDVQRVIVLDGYVHAHTFEGEEQLAGVKLVTDLEVYLFNEEAQCPPPDEESAPPEEKEEQPPEEKEEQPPEEEEEQPPEEEEEPAPEQEEGGKESEAEVALDITVTFYENMSGFHIESDVAFDLVVLVHCGLNLELELESEVKELTHITEDPLVGILVDVDGMMHFASEFVCPAPPDDPPAEACVGPQEITGQAFEDSANHIEWSAFEGADGYNLYRHDGDEEFELLTTTEANVTESLDDDVVHDTTYTYTVTAVVDDEETDACDKVEITAIPVLPTIFAVGAASLAGLGAYVMSRRVGS